MGKFIVADTRGATFYKHMENGRPVCGEREPSEFDAELASKICEQLATFKGDADWQAFEIIGPDALIEKFKTQKALAEKMLVSAGTICRWKKLGAIGVQHIPFAHRLLQS